MNRRLRIGILAAATLAAASVPQAAIAGDHSTFDATFPDELCGIAVMHQIHGIDNYSADGFGADSGRIVDVYTADNGRAVEVSVSGHLVNEAPVANPDGTLTLITRYSGAQMTTKAVPGPVLQTNSGRLEVRVVLDAAGDPVAVSVVVLAGPNPNTTGRPDCAVVGPYLAGA